MTHPVPPTLSAGMLRSMLALGLLAVASVSAQAPTTNTVNIWKAEASGAFT